MARRTLSIRFLGFGTAFLAAGLLLGAAWTTAKADPPRTRHKANFKQQVEQMEETWRTVQLSGDVAAMDKLLSDDYVGISMTGQVVTKEQQLERMRNRQLLLTKIVLDDVKVKLIGTTAVVTSLAEVEGTNDGQPMHGMYRYTRVYTRTPAGMWKITNFEATRVGPPGPPPQQQGGRRRNRPDGMGPGGPGSGGDGQGPGGPPANNGGASSTPPN